jgi:uncharacterized membrane protein
VHITLPFFRPKNADFTVFMYDLILRIHDRILLSTSAFCTGFNYGARTCEFLLTHDRSLAALYLEESGYCVSARAVLFIVINFVFASIRLTGLNVPAQPSIEGCRMVMVALVFLILNGEMNSTTLQKVASQESLGLEKRAGFRVLSTERPDLIGKWLNLKAEIFICFWNIRFFVAKTTAGKRQLLKWDRQAGGEPFCCQPRQLTWADKRSCVLPNCSPPASSRVTIE